MTPGRPVAWHAESVDDVAKSLGADPRRGLLPEEATARRERVGPNVLRPRKPEPLWKELLESLTEPLQLLLVAVGVAYFVFGEAADGFTILAVIVAVSSVEAINEVRAKRAVAALSSLSAPTTLVLRGGAPSEITAAELVPGDVVLLEPGRRVPADLRLVESVALRVDESSFTGESLPVAKRADEVLTEATELGDRVNMAYASTLVTAGRGRGLVVATGGATEVGHIAGLTEQAREPRTPLQQALRNLSRWLLWIALGFSVGIPVLGVLIAGLPFQEMLLTGLTLAFATIPEELPILITIVLGLGAYRLARRNAIVKHLRAAETLGSVSVVATDKTGTLTENRMRVVAVVPKGNRRRLLEVGVLANDAQVTPIGDTFEAMGDPTETALLRAAQEDGLDVQALRRSVRILEEHPFDDARKRMSVVVDSGGGRRLVLKGAPESVLSVSTRIRTDGGEDRPLDDDERAELQRRIETFSAQGLRVLAAAEGPDAVEQDLVLLGLFALEDPPRPEAASAVTALEGAGVRVPMVTGDHPATARAIAERVGIDASQVVRGRELDATPDGELPKLARDASVFARIAPEHKLRIVRALQEAGEAVAVTGDGVNDAPALQEATMGVAMGKSGTDVAREAADLVLADDDFATVTEAVRTGRVLFGNLSKAVRYYLAVKLALVSSSLVAVLLRLPVPFEPVQIILMELFMDLGASVTFVAQPPEEDVMARPPRNPRPPFMDRAMKFGIIGGGLSLGLVVIVSYLSATWRGSTVPQSQTAAFVAWMLGHIVLAAHMRTDHQPLVRQNPLANRPFLVWAATAMLVVVVGLVFSPLRNRLHLSPFEPSLWWIVIGAAVLLPSWWEPWKWARAHAKRTL